MKAINDNDDGTNSEAKVDSTVLLENLEDGENRFWVWLNKHRRYLLFYYLSTASHPPPPPPPPPLATCLQGWLADAVCPRWSDRSSGTACDSPHSTGQKEEMWQRKSSRASSWSSISQKCCHQVIWEYLLFLILREYPYMTVLHLY